MRYHTFWKARTGWDTTPFGKPEPDEIPHLLKSPNRMRYHTFWKARTGINNFESPTMYQLATWARTLERPRVTWQEPQSSPKVMSTSRESMRPRPSSRLPSHRAWHTAGQQISYGSCTDTALLWLQIHGEPKILAEAGIIVGIRSQIWDGYNAKALFTMIKNLFH